MRALPPGTQPMTCARLASSSTSLICTSAGPATCWTQNGRHAALTSGAPTMATGSRPPSSTGGCLPSLRSTGRASCSTPRRFRCAAPHHMTATRCTNCATRRGVTTRAAHLGASPSTTQRAVARADAARASCATSPWNSRTCYWSTSNLCASTRTTRTTSVGRAMDAGTTSLCSTRSAFPSRCPRLCRLSFTRPEAIAPMPSPSTSALLAPSIYPSTSCPCSSSTFRATGVMRPSILRHRPAGSRCPSPPMWHPSTSRPASATHLSSTRRTSAPRRGTCGAPGPARRGRDHGRASGAGRICAGARLLSKPTGSSARSPKARAARPIGLPARRATSETPRPYLSLDLPARLHCSASIPTSFALAVL
mmetsp:Transcript_17028/g.47495  ORF Transcript_17028/g.47495 Transcript_17028/m.47495 type:complete len:365 (+) Transcript_17028:82-1176(+)